MTVKRGLDDTSGQIPQVPDDTQDEGDALGNLDSDQNKLRNGERNLHMIFVGTKHTPAGFPSSLRLSGLSLLLSSDAGQ